MCHYQSLQSLDLRQACQSNCLKGFNSKTKTFVSKHLAQLVNNVTNGHLTNFTRDALFCFLNTYIFQSFLECKNFLYEMMILKLFYTVLYKIKNTASTTFKYF